MKFSIPELNRAAAEIGQLIESGSIEVSPVENQVYILMALVDRFRLAEAEAGGVYPPDGVGWTARTKTFEEIIAQLKSPEMRDQLRAWYDVDHELNPIATALRDWLGLVCGESFDR